MATGLTARLDTRKRRSARQRQISSLLNMENITCKCQHQINSQPDVNITCLTPSKHARNIVILSCCWYLSNLILLAARIKLTFGLVASPTTIYIYIQHITILPTSWTIRHWLSIDIDVDSRTFNLNSMNSFIGNILHQLFHWNSFDCAPTS